MNFCDKIERKPRLWAAFDFIAEMDRAFGGAPETTKSKPGMDGHPHWNKQDHQWGQGVQKRVAGPLCTLVIELSMNSVLREIFPNATNAMIRILMIIRFAIFQNSVSFSNFHTFSRRRLLVAIIN